MIYDIHNDVGNAAYYNVSQSDWNWPVAPFKFSVAGLCLGVSLNSRITTPKDSAQYYLLTTTCSNPFPYMSWQQNSRGMIASLQQFQPPSPKTACLNAKSSGALFLGSCSITSTTNRFIFNVKSAPDMAFQLVDTTAAG